MIERLDINDAKEWSEMEPLTAFPHRSVQTS
jgi:hypothetical protein